MKKYQAEILWTDIADRRKILEKQVISDIVDRIVEEKLKEERQKMRRTIDFYKQWKTEDIVDELADYLKLEFYKIDTTNFLLLIAIIFLFLDIVVNLFTKN